MVKGTKILQEIRYKEALVNNTEAKMAKITIQNIAKELGLSRNTVSMALKNSNLVAPQTRDLVLRYARRVGYMEDTAVQEEYRQTAYHIMILRKPDRAVYWDKVINGILEEASRNHCQTQVAVLTDEEEQANQFPLGLDEKISAIFCIKLISQEYLKKLKEKGFHMIMLDYYWDQQQELLGDVIRIEGLNATAYLTHHLIEQGMCRIGFLNEHSSIYETMHDRYMGYLKAMEQAGLAVASDWVYPDMESDHFYFQSTFDELVEQHTAFPEAVVCGNDRIAQYLTIAFRKNGIRVPEDVAVTGFDNDEDELIEPFFSTVQVNAKWLGKRMVQSFLWRMQNKEAPYEKIIVSGEVILRRSSAKIHK